MWVALPEFNGLQVIGIILVAYDEPGSQYTKNKKYKKLSSLKKLKNPYNKNPKKSKFISLKLLDQTLIHLN